MIHFDLRKFFKMGWKKLAQLDLLVSIKFGGIPNHPKPPGGSRSLGRQPSSASLSCETEVVKRPWKRKGDWCFIGVKHFFLHFFQAWGWAFFRSWDKILDRFNIISGEIQIFRVSFEVLMSSADHWRLLWDRGEGYFFLQMRAIHSFRSGFMHGITHRCAVICDLLGSQYILQLMTHDPLDILSNLTALRKTLCCPKGYPQCFTDNEIMI